VVHLLPPPLLQGRLQQELHRPPLDGLRALAVQQVDNDGDRDGNAARNPPE
jgi:hypothetical protein